MTGRKREVIPVNRANWTNAKEAVLTCRSAPSSSATQDTVNEYISPAWRPWMTADVVCD